MNLNNRAKVAAGEYGCCINLEAILLHRQTNQPDENSEKTKKNSAAMRNVSIVIM